MTGRSEIRQTGRGGGGGEEKKKKERTMRRREFGEVFANYNLLAYQAMFNWNL